MDLHTEIDFFEENIDFTLLHKTSLVLWIESCVIEETGLPPSSISTVFCNDEYLLEINQKYLNHEDWTDIITFQYTDKPVSGDLFISIERVEENAKSLKIPFENELYRVIIHGILHLCGYKDKTEKDAKIMREKEDYYLNILRVGHI
ncbi:rRNA maturation RNase YbeY [Membranihabitans marinus]|uniref:rRNA maturation RNase YbeY n=1 Tax=Membranihabitans marinus TaxID=1227546 RepID=UPI001F01AF16|nr:rRNA maturation RNase YbeY [Membranihabitans marinus]